MRGRPPKPSATLRASGGFRADRHADRLDENWQGGLVEPPGMLKRERDEWARLVQMIPDGILVGVDGEALLQYIRWKHLLNQNIKKAGKDYKAFCIASGAQKQLNALAAQLGFTPRARASIKLQIASEEEDPLDNLADAG